MRLLKNKYIRTHGVFESPTISKTIVKLNHKLITNPVICLFFKAYCSFKSFIYYLFDTQKKICLYKIDVKRQNEKKKNAFTRTIKIFDVKAFFYN